MSGPRILVLDIESYPTVAEVWSIHDPHIGLEQIREPGGILGFGYMWHGESRVYWTTNVAEDAARVLDEADIVVGYNSDAFDLKHLNREIARAGLTPPSPYKTVDLYKVVKRHFKFASHKLDFVAQSLGVGKKAATGGYGLWKACMAGDEAAMRKMAAYCRQDVRVTDALYVKLLPWISTHPNIGAYIEGDRCTKCGSTDLERRGYKVAAALIYQQWFCRGCGGWSRSVRGEAMQSSMRPA